MFREYKEIDEIDEKLEELANKMLKIELTLTMESKLDHEINMTYEEKVKEVKNVIDESKDIIGTIIEYDDLKMKIIDRFVDPFNKLNFHTQLKTIPFTIEDKKIKVAKIIAEALKISETDIEVLLDSDEQYISCKLTNYFYIQN